jgi:hypothetical protein
VPHERHFFASARTGVMESIPVFDIDSALVFLGVIPFAL